MGAIDVSPGWATYLRVSDEDKQTPERSFAMQRQRIQEQLLRDSKAPMYREYTDLLSGTKPNRKEYQEMLADAEAGKYSHLGLYRADRFGRNTIEGLQAATKLISLGVKIRVANMPSLQPEEPDGFFMFLIQMGMAQREVDVLAQRTADGMEAKLRAGGWPHKAPEGYINKERPLGSNKYERWVEQEPKDIQGLQLAWDLLLTDQYTLTQICEELARQGFTRASGLPWAWNDKQTGRRKTAHGSLHHAFHNPFYAGWATSKRFGIKLGEVRGKWKPIIDTDQFERGRQILLKHGHNKANFKRNHYLLRNLLWMRINGKSLKMYGSTPSGSHASFSYYRTSEDVDGKKLRIPTGKVDDQIPELLAGITIGQTDIPAIKEIYQEEIKSKTQDDKRGTLDSLRKKLDALGGEEQRLARLFMAEKVNEKVYDQLRNEWWEKTQNIKAMIKQLEFDSSHYLDDLKLALALLSRIPDLWDRFGEQDKAKLLRTIFKQIIIRSDGEIDIYELNSPFTYLATHATHVTGNHGREGDRSTSLLVSTPTATRTQVSASGGQRSVH